MSKLRPEIQAVLNRNSAENESNTPDFILAHYLLDCLAAFDAATRSREAWFGRAEEAWLASVDDVVA